MLSKGSITLLVQNHFYTSAHLLNFTGEEQPHNHAGDTAAHHHLGGASHGGAGDNLQPRTCQL